MASKTTKAKTRTLPSSTKADSPHYPVERFEDEAAWNGWLAKHHGTALGVFIEFAKKDSGIASVTYAQAVELALAWGWIDGQSKRVDERFYVQKFTPRGKRSLWSKINCDKAMALIAAGKMQPSGMLEVERAKADGRWDRAYDSPRNAVVPDDLMAALAQSAKAKAAFAKLDATNRYAILHRVMTATTPKTRAARIARIVEMLLAGGKFHP